MSNNLKSRLKRLETLRKPPARLPAGVYAQVRQQFEAEVDRALAYWQDNPDPPDTQLSPFMRLTRAYALGEISGDEYAAELKQRANEALARRP